MRYGYGCHIISEIIKKYFCSTYRIIITTYIISLQQFAPKSMIMKRKSSYLLGCQLLFYLPFSLLSCSCYIILVSRWLWNINDTCMLYISLDRLENICLYINLAESFGPLKQSFRGPFIFLLLRLLLFAALCTISAPWRHNNK